MKVILFGKNVKEIGPLVRAGGFQVVTKNPDFVVSYGGDGTLVRAEHVYPGLPKIVLKNSLVCKRCSPLPNQEVLQRIAKQQYIIEELIKLEATAGGETFYALNDLVIHNQDPRHAIRYSVAVNGRLLAESVIGDGVIVATPFGSTAYYRSITDSYFELGIGLAFNNSTEQADHVILKEDSRIKIKITRGPAVLYADNQDRELALEKDVEITIKKSTQKASMIVPK